MPDLSFKTIWRGWCEIEGSPRLKIPVCGRIRNLNDTHLWLALPPCPEVSAVLQGKKFSAGSEFVGNFECVLTEPRGTLKTASGTGGYTIDETDLKEASFLAYALPRPDSQSAVSLSIVNEIVGSNQVSIAPGGRIEASRNLVGQSIKVQVTYPKSVQISQEPVESVYLHLVGLWEDESVRYAGVMGCGVETAGRDLKLRIGAIEKTLKLQVA